MTTKQPSMRVGGVLGKPFQHQLAFFRNKLGNLVPTKRWDDIRREAHDTGFMVAGAIKTDLLADLAAAVDRSMSEGKSLNAFRKDFRAIVEKHGWHGWTGEESKAGQRWRTGVIYRTNAAVAYAAGRRAQLEEGNFKYWIYRHNDSVKNPRPQHLAWDGLTPPPDHPFWRTHTPVNSFGCKCYVVGARTQAGVKRMGGQPGREPPEGWDVIDPDTGTLPGIGKGWDYAPGASVSDTVRAMAEKTRQWEYELAKGYMQNVPAPVRDQLARGYRSLPSVADDTRRYAQRVLKGEGDQLPPYRTLGLLTQADADQISGLVEREVDGFDFALDTAAVLHVQSHHGAESGEASRGQRAVTAEDYEILPLLLNAGSDLAAVGQATATGSLLFERTFEWKGERYTAVFELRGKRKMLALKTFYIRPLARSGE